MKKQIATPFDSDAAKRAVIKVGGGRGFVMEIAEPNPSKKEVMVMGKRYPLPRFIRRRIVMTAAHCLPHLPPAHPWADTHEKTYRILGLLGTRPTILAECLFADPVDDLAVLGAPDSNVYDRAVDRWHTLMEKTNSLAIDVEKLERHTTGWLLFINGRWNRCTVRRGGQRGIWIANATNGIVAGMSGSPILSDNGRVIGLVSNSSGPQPFLARSLPVWLVESLRNDTTTKEKGSHGTTSKTGKEEGQP